MKLRLSDSESRKNRCRFVATCLLSMIATVGCSTGNALESSVVGKVMLDAKPVSEGSIVLIEQGGKLATSALQPDGGYSLRCAPGKYHVAISPPPPPDPFAPKSSAASVRTTIKIPQKYRDVGTSGLTFDVKQGANTCDVQLESLSKR